MTTPAAEPRRLRISAADLRLLGTCTAASVVLAVMTGPAGSSVQPTAGFKGSLESWRVVPFLVFGVVVWALMTGTRKLRSSESAGLALALSHVKASNASTWEAGLRHLSWRRAIGTVTLLATVVLALALSDLTGPYHADKLSPDSLWHQLTHIYTYGYLLFAAVLWALTSRRVLERHKLRTTPTPRTGRPHTILVTLGCLVFALVFSLAADPWLNPRFTGSYLLPTSATSIFHHWPTYLYLLAALLVARRILRIEGRRPRDPQSGRARFMTPQLSLAIYITALFIAIEWPKFLPAYWQSEMNSQIAIYALLALGLNVVVGYAGLLDLGYVAFFAVGAYTAAYFTYALPHHPPTELNLFLVAPIAIGAAMLTGVLLGMPTLRVRGDYLAIVTLGFGEIVEVLLTNWTSVTAGAAGTKQIPTFSINFLGIHYHWNNAVPLPYYYLILGFIIVAVFIFSSLNNSRVGRRWAAIREDEHAAASIGVNPLKYKVMAFAIGASTAGFAGVFIAGTTTSLFPTPSEFGLQLSILILALVIFGGMGSIVGVIVAAAFFNWLNLYLQLHPFPGYSQTDYLMYVGALFILIVIYRPQGILPSRRRAREFELATTGMVSGDPMGVFDESDQFERPRGSEAFGGGAVR